MKNFRTGPIFLAFLAMDLDGVGAFAGIAKSKFGIGDFEAQLLTTFGGFIAFGVLAIPMGLVQDRTTKKKILLAGLVVMLVGAAISFPGLKAHAQLLATAVLLGAGAATLQVAGNPIMRDVSGPEKYSRNLSLAQFVKAIGSLSGSVVPAIAGVALGMGLEVLFPIDTVILLVAIVWLAMTPIEEHRDAGAKPASFKSCVGLLRNGYILTMVLGIFLYVGAEVCLSSQVPIYLTKQFGLNPDTLALLGNSFFFVWLMVGRFLGSIVLTWISPAKFLLATVLVMILGIAGLLFAPNEAVAIASIVLAGSGCANVFPLVFSITVNHMPERTNEISGLMITAIAGGAILPLVMGGLAQATGSASMGFLVPLLCGLYLLAVSAACLKQAANPAKSA